MCSVPVDHCYSFARSESMSSPYAGSVEMCAQLNGFCCESVCFYDNAIGFYLGWSGTEKRGIRKLHVSVSVQTAAYHRSDDRVPLGLQCVYPKIIFRRNRGHRGENLIGSWAVNFAETAL